MNEFKKTITQQAKATGAIRPTRERNILLDARLFDGIAELHKIPADVIRTAAEKAVFSSDYISFDFTANNTHYYVDMVTDRHIIRDRENAGKIKYFYHIPRQFRLYGYTAEDRYYNRPASEQDGSPILNYHGRTHEIEL